MSNLMKEQITKDFTEICLRYQLPEEKIIRIRAAVATILNEEDYDSFPFEKVFPNLHQGSAIRG